MADALSILETNVKKLTSKVERLRSQLVAAETELAESETAIRVLSRLGVSASVDLPGGEEVKASSQEQVLRVLPTALSHAKTPRDVHQLLLATGVTISAENVRTILSRLRKDEAIQVSEGRYWREDATEQDADDDDEGDFDYLVEVPFDGTRSPLDEDLDNEVPF